MDMKYIVQELDGEWRDVESYETVAEADAALRKRAVESCTEGRVVRREPGKDDHALFWHPAFNRPVWM